MRVTLIHNATAGDRSNLSRHELVDAIERAGHVVAYQDAGDPGWATALELPADIVAVAGGDGTVGSVAKCAARRGLPMAALPFGTANNIARSLGLVDRPCGDLIEGWGGARRVKLDVGSCSGIGEPRNFIEGVGLGLFTDFLADRGAKDILARIEDTEQQVDTALGMLAERARTASPIEVRMELDGSEVAGRYLLIEALNISHVGPNLFLAPDSVPGDGRLDVVSVAESERERLIAYLHAWRHERSKEALLPTRSVKQLRFGRLTSVHIDDERLAKDELSDTLQVALDAGSVEFLVPLDS